MVVVRREAPEPISRPAGALHVNLNDLRSYRWPIGLLATFGVLIATAVIGSLAYYIFALFGWHVSFLYCLLFGALISPTDPIAVLGVLRTANASKPLKTTIVGESLFPPYGRMDRHMNAPYSLART